MRLTVRVRVYDAGLALRYELEGGAGETELEGEETALRLDASFDTVFAQDLVASYEGPYLKRDWRDMQGQSYGMPLLAHAPASGLWLLISEAEVLSKEGRWCSSHLRGGAAGELLVAGAPQDAGSPAPLALPCASPWRIVTVAAGLDEMINSHLCYDVNPPAPARDYGWVRPARALWAWWEYENGAQLYSESKHYVDFAAAMGFEAVTLDCGWDANWVKRICEYAHARGVQVWIWTARQRVDTWETANRLIPMWAGWGVDGLKIDFFENDSRDVMQVYGMLAALMLKYRLMINFHGATKPMGEGRTWPHLMTSEGIMGLEHYKWSDMPNAQHNCTVPFTRNVSGPMDYTPLGFSNANRNTTHAHQLALPVVFESGVTHYSASIFYLEPWLGTRFLRRTRAHYDEVRLLAGYPGRDVAVMRRAGDEYVIGAITTLRQTMALPLDFLPEGQWQAEIYEDDGGDHMIRMRTQTVSRGQRLELPLLQNGGAAVYIARELAEPRGGVRGGWMSDRAIALNMGDARLSGGSEPVRLSEDVSGALLYGAAEWTVRAEHDGLYTLRVTYSSERPWELNVRGTAGEASAAMPASRSHWDLIVHDAVVRLQAGANVLRLARAGGDVPAVTAVRLIDNAPCPTVRYPAAEARLGAGAELIEKAPGVWDAVGLGGSADITFEHVAASAAGRYILAISYCGGESRNISIEVNGGGRIDTYLHCTAGWGFARWDVNEDKEVLVDLRAGDNAIRLFCDDGPMSHIRGIALTRDGE